MLQRSYSIAIGLAWLLFFATGCISDGQIAFLGYTTKPPYDPSIRTVFVPIFGNETYLRGIEFEMTKAVIRELESKTPYKVVSNCADADTQLDGKIMTRRKAPNNMNQLGEVRDVEQGLVVEVRWKDLRSGELLSVPNGFRRKEPDLGSDAKPPAAPWVQITPSASYVPELGGTTTSGRDLMYKQVARQIVHMMEIWNVDCPK
jgi:hypothetical protein